LSYNDTKSKKWLENNFTSTYSTSTSQVGRWWVSGACQAMADGKTKIETLTQAM